MPLWFWDLKEVRDQNARPMKKSTSSHTKSHDLVFMPVLGAVATLFFSRSSVYGYDQRCEIFGTDGLVSVNNVPDHTTVLSNRSGNHHARLQHSLSTALLDRVWMRIRCFLRHGVAPKTVARDATSMCDGTAHC